MSSAAHSREPSPSASSSQQHHTQQQQQQRRPSQSAVREEPAGLWYDANDHPTDDARQQQLRQQQQPQPQQLSPQQQQPPQAASSNQLGVGQGGGQQSQGGPSSAPVSGSPSPRLADATPGRLNVPQRSSTYGGPHDLERNRHRDYDGVPHARSEDLNHNSRAGNNHTIQGVNNGALPANVAASACAACGRPMQGAFVRALGTVFHLNCFKCLDCGTVVASKFFPIDGPDGKQYPLCERDYFRRLNLICAQCGMALRGSYITACNKKFHVEHFTCSLCDTLFGPQDSYYEHDGDVYCHYHYSTRFATKCAGCNSAILKQFVEINRNNRDECWHPECYMINKFWNVKLVSRKSMILPAPSDGDASQSQSQLSQSSDQLSENGRPSEPDYAEEEKRETATSLKDKQARMEQQVYRIWTVLSAFEESSAACISDMLRQVSNGQYLEAIRMAEKFILHVEVLFATIDDLEYHFARLNLKGMSHVREARMLCRKTVDLFTLLSHTQETGARRMGMTQELLALVTGLAHYLKILIRIALTGALKLEREQNVRDAISNFLDKLHLLAVQGGNPGAKRVLKGAHGAEMVVTNGSGPGFGGTQGVTYGFRSLAPELAGDSPFAPQTHGHAPNKPTSPPSDLCVKCGQTVEEDCVRLGTYQRWHSNCVQCQTCGKVAAVQGPKEKDRERERSGGEGDGKEEKPKLSTARRPPANVGMFVYDEASMADSPSSGRYPTVIYCTEHAHPGCKGGFQPVSRLEQYAFLLNVALRRLYILLKKRGVVPLSPVPGGQGAIQQGPDQDPYRNSGDIMRMKSVHLDRKLSATARIAKRSTIVESPAGKSVQPTDVGITSERSRELIPASSSARTVGATYPQSQQQAQLPPVRPPRPPQSQSPLDPAPPTRQANGPGPLPPASIHEGQQVIRPPYARHNTEVMIVDESMPNSPAIGSEEQSPMGLPAPDEGITLADIPQLMEAAQAREQHRSLPRQSQVPFIAELSPLELAIVKHCAVLVLHGSPLRNEFDLDEILELIEVKKSGFWNRWFKGGNDKKIKKKGVFGVPLELLVEREGADSVLGASRTTLRIPSFIDDVVSAMRQMDMSIEGIFRKNGNIRRLKDLTEAIDRDPNSVDLTTDNPVQLAALLKKFLRDLPDPLLTFKLHRLLIASQSLPKEEDRMRLLHMINLLLPKVHRDTMEVLFVFLKWVASFAHTDDETGSKMDLPNLATVICPSILYSRGRDGVRDESFGGIRVVTALLENQDQFYLVPEEFLPILHDQEYFANSLDLPAKEFMKKCGTYMRVKAQGRAPIPGPPIASPTATSPFGSNNTSGSLASMMQDGRPQRPSTARPNTSPSSDQLGNGGLSKRQQSPQPPPLTHSPMSFPSAGSAPSSLAQTIASINQGGEQDWVALQRRGGPTSPAMQPPTRPASYVGTPRNSGEHPPFSPPGHQVQLRQRT
ncbi:RhoGAP-domain-containing protein [Punctularia strigosozonata HHB-11173 SS5]|uniref:RhoGAP-domain-containing protein n=1 Tax=Punctularia strigosozonata (strain HHB-11173) TaxID=741275 RepID=UPI0004417A21|nr:RhoGAP-domain-containing protein [Punctularia strigosozonata HHB-11173 SS5]EIN06077.1 RhoGAP-domain-containing protein [Punctularia strigosozonata HHB-11173 SS5]